MVRRFSRESSRAAPPTLQRIGVIGRLRLIRADLLQIGSSLRRFPPAAAAGPRIGRDKSGYHAAFSADAAASQSLTAFRKAWLKNSDSGDGEPSGAGMTRAGGAVQVEEE